MKISTKSKIANPYGYYKFTGIKKVLYKLAQRLPKNTFGFKTALVLRKLCLQNRIDIVDEIQFGLKLRLYPLDNLGDRYLLFMPKFSNQLEFNIMSENLNPNSIFIDIGANVGMFSLTAAKYITTGRILSFEPNPTLLERLKFNSEINGFDHVIEPYQFGIADKESSFRLSQNSKNLGGASIVNDSGEYHITVSCRPLHDVLKEQNIEHIDLLKIDIENAEPLALNPFFEKAPRGMFPKMIIIESDEGIKLTKLGYKLIAKHESNSIYRLD